MKNKKQETHCMHGYSEKAKNCATCHKDANQCDWGACESTNVRPYRRFVNNKHVETRNLCAEHLKASFELNPTDCYL